MGNKEKFQSELTAGFNAFIERAFCQGLDYSLTQVSDGQILGLLVGAKCFDGITQKQFDEFSDIMAKIRQGYKKMIKSSNEEITVQEAVHWICEYRDFASAEIQKILGK